MLNLSFYMLLEHQTNLLRGFFKEDNCDFMFASLQIVPWDLF